MHFRENIHFLKPAREPDGGRLLGQCPVGEVV